MQLGLEREISEEEEEFEDDSDISNALSVARKGTLRGPPLTLKIAGPTPK